MDGTDGLGGRVARGRGSVDSTRRSKEFPPGFVTLSDVTRSDYPINDVWDFSGDGCSEVGAWWRDVVIPTLLGGPVAAHWTPDDMPRARRWGLRGIREVGRVPVVCGRQE